MGHGECRNTLHKNNTTGLWQQRNDPAQRGREHSSGSIRRLQCVHEHAPKEPLLAPKPPRISLTSALWHGVLTVMAWLGEVSTVCFQGLRGCYRPRWTYC
jgi:hypothetical protein